MNEPSAHLLLAMAVKACRPEPAGRILLIFHFHISQILH
jgi:hypothetical protein